MASVQLSMRRIFHTWWPLAASWLLMGIEAPLITAVITRLANPEISLASYGGIIFPLALFIESPIMMLLAASTALSKDWGSFRKIRNFMIVAGVCLTLFHILLAFTPLYYLVVVQLLGSPEEIVEPARIGLMIMTPWTMSIAYRRFHQGILIRYGRSKAVSTGTLIRLIADIAVLLIGYFLHNITGIIVATSALVAGVITEAIYAGIIAHPVIRDKVTPAPIIEPGLTYPRFIRFYFPLVLTSLLSLLVQPVGAAALSRMPLPIESLAVWSVVTGLLFIFRSFGIAYNEVVVALLDENRSVKILWRFAGYLLIITSSIWLLIMATPLSKLWFHTIYALPTHLANLAQKGIWITLPIPALTVLQSCYQGAILHSNKTRAITEAIVIYLIVNISILFIGVRVGRITGLYIGLVSFSLSTLLQTVWLWYRSQVAINSVHRRDEIEISSSSLQTML